MDSVMAAEAEILNRSYCNFLERVGGYVPRESLPLGSLEALSDSDKAALEAIKREFGDLNGVESVTITENAPSLRGDDSICCRHLITVKLRTIPLKERVENMNSSFHYKIKKLRLKSVELRIEWENFIFDPPL